MRRTYAEIKSKAKSRLHERFGTALAVVYVPGLIVMAITMITSELTVFLPDIPELITDYIIGVLLGFGASYISLKLLIQYIRGKNEISFSELFKFEKDLLPFVFYRLILSGVFLISFLPLIPLIYEVFTNIIIMEDPVAIEQYFRSSEVILELMNGFIISFSLLFISLLLMVRFQFAPYVIIHKKADFIAGMKKSWEITSGSYFRILFFPLSFILWILLGITTCGLGFFYVSPYMIVANGYMYITLMQESDNPVDYISSPAKPVREDPLAEYYD
jgi:hypothetical protein